MGVPETSSERGLASLSEISNGPPCNYVSLCATLLSRNKARSPFAGPLPACFSRARSGLRPCPRRRPCAPPETGPVLPVLHCRRLPGRPPAWGRASPRACSPVSGESQSPQAPPGTLRRLGWGRRPSLAPSQIVRIAVYLSIRYRCPSAIHAVLWGRGLPGLRNSTTAGLALRPGRPLLEVVGRRFYLARFSVLRPGPTRLCSAASHADLRPCMGGCATAGQTWASDGLAAVWQNEAYGINAIASRSETYAWGWE